MCLIIHSTNIAEEEVYVELAGELVLGEESTGKLRSVLENYIADDYRAIWVSAAHVTKIDCPGVGVLVGAYASATNAGAHLYLRHLSPRVHEVLTIFKLACVFGPEACTPPKAA